MAGLEKLISRMALPPDTGGGRPLKELIETDDVLSGAESQRLRSYFSTTSMQPHRDLDVYGWAIVNGDLDILKEMYTAAFAEARMTCDTEEAACQAVAQEIYQKRWGPTRVPIFNLILLATLLQSDRRARQLEVARWLIDEVKVPIDGADLSGSTALHHAISTKPSFDPEYAQLLYDAGGNFNIRNRYGGTPAHEITMIWAMNDREVVGRAAEALKWFLDHGGNIDIKDSDGMTARRNVDISRRSQAASSSRVPMATWKIVDEEDKRRKRFSGKICAFCGRSPREGVRLLACSRCKGVKYCSTWSMTTCQRADWPNHKLTCKKAD